MDAVDPGAGVEVTAGVDIVSAEVPAEAGGRDFMSVDTIYVQPDTASVITAIRMIREPLRSIAVPGPGAAVFFAAPLLPICP
jgi:hypothetical protein